MRIKTSELTGAALDWAVAKCWYGDEYDMSIPLFEDGKLFAPSTTWAQGGPIIEGERIAISAHLDGEEWVANDYWNDNEYTQVGPTPLIAAMRCFVASRLGDEVDVLEELRKA